MKRTGNTFTFDGRELTILFENLDFALRHLTDDFTDDQAVRLYRREINLLNAIDETL